MTSFLAVNGRPKYKDTCILCGESDYLTGEHIFAQWIGKTVYPSESEYIKQYLFTQLDENIEIFDLSNLGGHANARLNVLCETCNSKWGSILQQDTSLILKPIIKEKKWKIANADCQQIASWVTSFVMVRQFMHPELKVLNSVQCKSFFDTSLPLPSLSLWVANFEGIERQLSSWYTALAHTLNSTKSEIFLLNFAMGNIIFFAYGASENMDKDTLHETMRPLRLRLVELGLVPVWPLASHYPISEPLILNDEKYKNLMPLLKRSLFYPTESLGLANITLTQDVERTKSNNPSLSSQAVQVKQSPSMLSGSR